MEDTGARRTGLNWPRAAPAFPGSPRARHQSLALRVGLIMMMALVVGTAVLGVSARHLVHEQFGAVEAGLLQRNRKVLRDSVAAQLQHLGTFTRYWSHWAALREYVLGRNPDFAATELGTRALQQIGIDFAMILDAQGKILHFAISDNFGVNGTDGDGQEHPEWKIERRVVEALSGKRVSAPHHPWAVDGAPPPPVESSGLVDTLAGPVAIAVASIPDRDGRTAESGRVVMGRVLQATQLASRLTVLPSEVLMYGNGLSPMPEDIHAIARRVLGEPAESLLVPGNDVISDFHVFRDIMGDPSFLLEVRMPRTIVAAGKKTGERLVLILFVFMAVLLCAVGAIVHWSVSVRVARLTKHIVRMRATGEQLPAPGRDAADEVGTLARNFDELIATVNDQHGRFRRLAAAVESAGDAVAILDREGRIEYVNPEYERQTGYGWDEVTGHVPAHSFPEDGNLADLWSTVRAGQQWSGVHRVICRDGQVRHTEVTMSPIKDDSGEVISFVAVSRDITVRRQIEQELRKLSTVVEHTAHGIVVLDTDGTIQYVNPAFERSRRVRGSDVVGRKPGARTTGLDDPGYYEEMWRTVRAGRTWLGRFTSQLPDGAIIMEDAVVSPVIAAGQAPSAFVIILHDVTLRVQLENDLAQARKLEAVGRLAAGVAHEINTPTQYVGGNIRFLRDAFGSVAGVVEQLRDLARAAGTGPVDGRRLGALLDQLETDDLHTEVPAAIRQSLEGVERVTEIVQSMKELAHPGQGLASADINRVVESAVRIASSEWQGRAEIRAELDPSLPPVPCLAGGINQVIVNMIVNAAHAIEDAAELRDSKGGTIVVRTVRAGDHAEIIIVDDGIGMTPEIRSRIFDPFFTTKEVGRGTGQGLAIAHTVVKKHGGTIDVESAPGVGTRFIIRLPLSPAQGDDAGARDATAA